MTPGELKLLSRGELLLFAGRCAIRVEPWIPEGAAVLWGEGLAFLVEGALTDEADAKEAGERHRALSDSGARACNLLASTDEPLGRCMNYAMCTLATAVRATATEDWAAVRKDVIDAAKLSASIAAVWAHAGRVKAAPGQDAVDVACTTTWAAIRADVERLAGRAGALRGATDPVRALRDVAPSWPGANPPWAAPPRR